MEEPKNSKDYISPTYTKERWEIAQHARAVTYEYNHSHPSDRVRRRELLDELFAELGERSTIEPPFHCDCGCNIHIGEHFYANANCIILDEAPVHIGDNVQLGPNVSIYAVGHPIHHESRNKNGAYVIKTAPVTIGNNVWIGGGTIINPGITIGDNTVIGAGSVVTRDIPGGVIAVGNPCKVLRPITDEDKE